MITYSKRNLRNRNKEDLAESTGVVPAKYPPKVKLERISTILECQNWEKIFPCRDSGREMQDISILGFLKIT